MVCLVQAAHHQRLWVDFIRHVILFVVYFFYWLNWWLTNTFPHRQPLFAHHIQTKRKTQDILFMFIPFIGTSSEKENDFSGFISFEQDWNGKLFASRIKVECSANKMKKTNFNAFDELQVKNACFYAARKLIVYKFNGREL